MGSIRWYEFEDGVADELEESLISRELLCEWTGDRPPCDDDAAGEFCAERYRLLEEGWLRIEGSEKLAIALGFLSRARPASVNNPPRFPFVDELRENVDWRCLGLKVGRDGVSGAKVGDCDGVDKEAGTEVAEVVRFESFEERADRG